MYYFLLIQLILWDAQALPHAEWGARIYVHAIGSEHWDSKANLGRRRFPERREMTTPSKGSQGPLLSQWRVFQGNHWPLSPHAPLKNVHLPRNPSVTLSKPADHHKPRDLTTGEPASWAVCSMGAILLAQWLLQTPRNCRKEKCMH